MSRALGPALIVAAALAAAAPSAGCYAPGFEACAVACGAGGACPAGLACGAAGLCEASPGACGGIDGASADGGRGDGARADGRPRDAGPSDAYPSDASAGDGGPGDAGGADGGAVSACTMPVSSAYLTDDFDDGTFGAWAWWYGQEYAEALGRLIIDLSGDAMQYSGATSRMIFDAQGTRFVVEVPVVAAPATGIETYFWYIDTDDEANLHAGFRLQNGHLQAGGAAIPYDPVAHRWWQLCAVGAVIHLETSPDGATWTPFTQLAFPTWGGLAEIELGAGTWQVVADPGEVHFDNLNLPP